MGPYKPLRTWVDEFIPYYMENPLYGKPMGVDRPDRTYHKPTKSGWRQEYVTAHQRKLAMELLQQKKKELIQMGVEPKIGVFTPQKWMVKIMGKPYEQMDDLGFSPYFWKHPHIPWKLMFNIPRTRKNHLFFGGFPIFLVQHPKSRGAQSSQGKFWGGYLQPFPTVGRLFLSGGIFFWC